MQILTVVHQFLPRHVAGTEIYTYRLAKALGNRGHRVHLFATEIRPDRPQYELTRGEYDGISLFEAVHNREFSSFRQTYRDPRMEQLFATVLDETTPDVVHFQHLHLHSIGYIDMVRERRVPMVYTLHEYMLICLNNGLLLRAGPTPCDGAEPGACARCASVAYPGLTLEPGPVASLRRLAGKLAPRRGPVPPSRGDDRRYVAAVRRRRSEIGAALAKVDRFIAPSRFLRDRFVAEGLIAPEHIVYSDYGFFVEPFAHLTRRPSTRLRVGYVGTLSEYKGVHLLVEAVRELPSSRIDCRVYGDMDVFPEYRQRLLALGVPPSLRYMGAVANEMVPGVLADLDVLVVPSIWPENSPLTIHEAFLAGVPVVTSDHGGMAELVADGQTGLHFQRGNAADLRRQLLRLLNDPGLLESLRRRLPAVKTIDEDAALMEERYNELRQLTAQ